MGDTRGGRAPDQWRDFQGLDDRIVALERLQQADRYDFLGSFVRSADRTLLTFSNISQIYSHLRVVFIGQSTRSGFPNTGFRFNFSTVAGTISSAWNFNYWGYGNGAGGVIQGQSAGGGSGYLGQTPAANRTNDNYVSHGTIDIPFYSRNDIIKSFLVNSTTHDGASHQHSHVGGDDGDVDLRRRRGQRQHARTAIVGPPLRHLVTDGYRPTQRPCPGIDSRA
jgi:hypothetical protein